MNEVILTNDQNEALIRLNNWYNSNSYFTTLNGPAGTGKTWLAQHLIKVLKLNPNNCCVAAPTHKAKEVIGKNCPLDAYTLHQLLGIGINLDISEFDPLNPIFHVVNKQIIEDYSFVIIDEASQINEELYETLKAICYRNYIKVLFIGDEVQVNPVNEEISYVFSNTDVDVITLTEIVRQEKDNPLIQLLSVLRKDVINDTNNYLELIKEPTEVLYNNKGYIIYNEGAKILEKVVFLISHNIDCKCLNWSNNAVTAWNNKIVEKVFGSLRLHEKQIITATQTLREGKNEPLLVNSKDYVILSITPSTKIVERIKLTGKTLKIRNGNDITELFCVGSPSKDVITEMCYAQQEIAKRTGGGKGWSKYYRFRLKFVLAFDLKTNRGTVIEKKNFTFGYSCTTHKSQGSTYTSVIVNYKNLVRNPNNLEMKRLLYVALSRASETAYILI